MIFERYVFEVFGVSGWRVLCCGILFVWSCEDCIYGLDGVVLRNFELNGV